MELTFANGTSTQQQLWGDGLALLRHLPLEALPLSVEVSFVPPEDVGQTSFAETTWTYDSTESSTKVRNDAPGFGDVDAALIAEAAANGLTWDAHLHFNETASHELGHSLFAALPQGTRLAILALFGITTDDLDVLAPPGSDWHDRPIEAIAETFKEAFLPARHRVFPSRTNLKLSYDRFPEFRRLFRDAVPSVEATGELPPGETPIPSYALDLFAQGEPLPLAGYTEEFGYLPGAGGKHGLWSTVLTEASIGEPPERAGASLLGEAVPIGVWVPSGSTVNYSFTIPTSAFPNPTSEVRWTLWYHSFVAGPIFPYLWNGRWIKQPDPEFPPYTKEDDAVAAGDPPVTVSQAILVDSRFSKTRVCKGQVYRYVELVAQIWFAFEADYVYAEHEAIRQAVLYPWMPSLTISRPSCQGGSGETGQPIVIPDSDMTPMGASTGARPRLRPVGGSGSTAPTPPGRPPLPEEEIITS